MASKSLALPAAPLVSGAMLQRNVRDADIGRANLSTAAAAIAAHLANLPNTSGDAAGASYTAVEYLTYRG
jgi:hypothetical protein